ncbi:hypothetical protein FGO68_gene2755 [Halteria grandinella]|uniref:Uncharacterized protein n=1 Tax=Halteria grandinella TaxID=5974 RepID=A0A8J8NWN7_HALGN|nr:hypothetical protein FGO68_gene2755 [Halteria grandinella]
MLLSGGDFGIQGVKRTKQSVDPSQIHQEDRRDIYLKLNFEPHYGLTAKQESFIKVQNQNIPSLKEKRLNENGQQIRKYSEHDVTQIGKQYVDSQTFQKDIRGTLNRDQRLNPHERMIKLSPDMLFHNNSLHPSQYLDSSLYPLKAIHDLPCEGLESRSHQKIFSNQTIVPAISADNINPLQIFTQHSQESPSKRFQRQHLSYGGSINAEIGGGIYTPDKVILPHTYFQKPSPPLIQTLANPGSSPFKVFQQRNQMETMQKFAQASEQLDTQQLRSQISKYPVGMLNLGPSSSQLQFSPEKKNQSQRLHVDTKPFSGKALTQVPNTPTKQQYFNGEQGKVKGGLQRASSISYREQLTSFSGIGSSIISKPNNFERGQLMVATDQDPRSSSVRKGSLRGY